RNQIARPRADAAEIPESDPISHFIFGPSDHIFGARRGLCVRAALTALNRHEERKRRVRTDRAALQKNAAGFLVDQHNLRVLPKIRWCPKVVLLFTDA